MISEINIFKDKKIGLSISGGADSALLAFYLMKNLDQPLHLFTYGSKEKHNRTIRNALTVVETCISLTGNTNVYHYIRYGETQDRDQFFKYLLDSIDNNIVDLIYTGTTSTPPESILKTFNQKLSLDIKTRRDPNLLKSVWSHNQKLYHPFINKDKQYIAKIYKDLNLIESLYSVTNSCESLDFSTGHCGKCWWCQERIWAFGES